MKKLSDLINESNNFGPSDNSGKYAITGSKGTVPMCLWDAFCERIVNEKDKDELKKKLVDAINVTTFEEEQLEHTLNQLTDDKNYSSKQWVAQKNSDTMITVSRKDKYGNLIQLNISKK